jgi:hypothetical protein
MKSLKITKEISENLLVQKVDHKNINDNNTKIEKEKKKKKFKKNIENKCIFQYLN